MKKNLQRSGFSGSNPRMKLNDFLYYYFLLIFVAFGKISSIEQKINDQPIHSYRSTGNVAI